MVISLLGLLIAALLMEWAFIINVNSQLLELRSAKILVIVFAVLLIFGAFGILIWI